MSTQTSTEGSISARLRHLRGERSQEEFAQIIGLSRSALANYETGRTKPKPSILRQISERLGLSEDFLLSGSFRNEYELNLVTTGSGFINERHETEDELAFVRVLRAVDPLTVKAIAGLLLDAVADSPEVRSRLKGLRVDADILRLAAVFKAGGQYEQGYEDTSLDDFVRAIAKKARAD